MTRSFAGTQLRNKDKLLDGVPLLQLARLIPMYKSGYFFALYREKLGAGVNTCMLYLWELRK